ncbi:MAG: hypothetical protein H5T76_20850 [Streptomyces sp.]|nr:hypothetical protein [Streptomyces sp.]
MGDGGGSGAAARDERALEYALALLAEARSEIDRADNKAQILLAGAGIGAGALAGGLLAGSWSPRSLHASVQWLWWLGFGAGGAGVGMLARAVYPRRSRFARVRPVASVDYFMDAAAFTSDEELVAALRRSTDRRLEAAAGQLRLVSGIAAVKYRAVASAMWLLCAAVVACAAAVACDAWVV